MNHYSGVPSFKFNCNAFISGSTILLIQQDRLYKMASKGIFMPKTEHTGEIVNSRKIGAMHRVLFALGRQECHWNASVNTRVLSVLCAAVWDPEQLQDQHQRTFSSLSLQTYWTAALHPLPSFQALLPHNCSLNLICVQGERIAVC